MVDDSLSSYVFKTIIEKLDREKNVFLQSEYDILAKHQYKIDNYIVNQDCSFLDEIALYYKKGLIRKLKNIEIVVFDVDYFRFINFFFIKKINGRKKILISGDYDQHEIHSITANACDLVLSGCPFSVLKYREKGYEAHWMHYESGKINNNVDEKKEFDVLFFGAITPARKEVLDYIIKKGINLKNVGHYEHSTDLLPIEKITKLI